MTGRGYNCGGVLQAINQVMVLTIRADHAAPAEEWDGSWSVRYHCAEARLALGHRLSMNTRVTSLPWSLVAAVRGLVNVKTISHN